MCVYVCVCVCVCVWVWVWVWVWVCVGVCMCVCVCVCVCVSLCSLALLHLLLCVLGAGNRTIVRSTIGLSMCVWGLLYGGCSGVGAPLVWGLLWYGGCPGMGSALVWGLLWYGGCSGVVVLWAAFFLLIQTLHCFVGILTVFSFCVGFVFSCHVHIITVFPSPSLFPGAPPSPLPFSGAPPSPLPPLPCSLMLLPLPSHPVRTTRWCSGTPAKPVGHFSD